MALPPGSCPHAVGATAAEALMGVYGAWQTRGSDEGTLGRPWGHSPLAAATPGPAPETGGPGERRSRSGRHCPYVRGTQAQEAGAASGGSGARRLRVGLDPD